MNAAAPLDMAATCAPKSDQLNADDLIGGPRTITVTGVRANPDAPDQPVSVFFDGDNGKPYKPCKSMRRVMVAAWGADAHQYPGRSLTVYCDPGVAFGGMKVGGIRISHMSHLDRDLTIALTTTRAKRAPFSVKRLAEAPVVASSTADAAADWTAKYVAAIEGAGDVPTLDGIVSARAKKLAELQAKRPELAKRCTDAFHNRARELAPSPELHEPEPADTAAQPPAADPEDKF